MTLNISLTIKIIFGFIACTIIGTLSHEYGHILSAKTLGYNTVLHYGSMDYTGGVKDELMALKNTTELDSSYIANQRNLLLPKFRKESLLISLGGPIQTILVSLLGLTYLLLTKSKEWSNFSWIALFAAFFSSRFVFNFIIDCFYRITSGAFQFTGDEGKIAWLMGWPLFTLPLGMFLIGCIIYSYCIFTLLPKKHLNSFLVGGTTGGLLGFHIWMNLLGPMILP